jgi:hypothetical protein
MERDIKPGDMIIPSVWDGLGKNPFLVLEVHAKSQLRPLKVRGQNGNTWWARAEGAKVISSVQSL